MRKLLRVLLSTVVGAAVAQGASAGDDHSDGARHGAARPVSVADADGKYVGEYGSYSVNFAVKGALVRVGLEDISQDGRFSPVSMRFVNSTPNFDYTTADCTGTPVLPSSFPGFRPSVVVRDAGRVTLYIGVDGTSGYVTSRSYLDTSNGTCVQRELPVVNAQVEDIVVLTDLYPEPLHLR